VAEGLHFATTRIELRYRRAARFDEEIEIATWLAWLRGASLGMGYEITRDGECLATASSEHALVDTSGRPRRIPEERRRSLEGRVGT
jgi:acyl-CoA thioester hydrolase